MSNVDSAKRIQEINSLKISDGEKARLIRSLMFMKKQTAPVKALTTNSSNVTRPPISVRVYERASPLDPFKIQIMSILKQEITRQQKMDNIQVVVNQRRQVV